MLFSPLSTDGLGDFRRQQRYTRHMRRFRIVLCTFLLSSTPAFACDNASNVSDDRGSDKIASHRAPPAPDTRNALRSRDPCTALHRDSFADTQRHTPQTGIRAATAQTTSSGTVRLATGQVPVRPRFRNLTPNDPNRPTPVAESSDSLESAMWRIVKESKDPADYEAFLDIYPNGRFAKQARKSLARLQNEKGGAAAPKTRSPTPARAEKIDRIDQTYTVRVTANLRQAPTTKAKIVGQAKKGQKIFVLGRTVGKNWYKVSSKAGTVAYIAGNLVSKPGAETQTPDADWRKRAPTASKTQHRASKNPRFSPQTAKRIRRARSPRRRSWAPARHRPRPSANRQRKSRPIGRAGSTSSRIPARTEIAPCMSATDLKIRRNSIFAKNETKKSNICRARWNGR